MKIRHVLMPTDLSEEAARPFGPISGLIREHKARLTVLHVLQDLPIAPVDAPFAPPIPASSLEQDREAAEATLKRLYADLDAGFEIQTRVTSHHNQALGIVEFAESEDVDLIALSTHGRTGFRRLVLGSITEEVLRRSSVPVLSFHRVNG